MLEGRRSLKSKKLWEFLDRSKFVKIFAALKHKYEEDMKAIERF